MFGLLPGPLYFGQGATGLEILLGSMTTGNAVHPNDGLNESGVFPVQNKTLPYQTHQQFRYFKLPWKVCFYHIIYILGQLA